MARTRLSVEWLDRRDVPAVLTGETPETPEPVEPVVEVTSEVTEEPEVTPTEEPPVEDPVLAPETGPEAETGGDDVVIPPPMPPEPLPVKAPWVPVSSPGIVLVKDESGTLIRTLTPYGSAYTGGIFTALGDVTGDGVADVVTGAAMGGPHVKVFDGQTGAEVRSFYAFDASFAGGVRVAAGDINGDGAAEIVVAAGPNGGPHVKAFDGKTGDVIRSFFAYDPAFRGGVWVAAGDTTGDGLADIVTGSGGFERGPGLDGLPKPTRYLDMQRLRSVDVPVPSVGSHVKVFSNGADEISSFYAFPPNVTGGVRVGVVDADGDGVFEVLAASGQGSTPEISRFNTWGTGLKNVRPFGDGEQGGIYLTANSAGTIRATTGNGLNSQLLDDTTFLVPVPVPADAG